MWFVGSNVLTLSWISVATRPFSPNRERVPTEEYQAGERVRAFVKAVETTAHGPEIILSRADPMFVIKLFQLEWRRSRTAIEVKAIAREPGYRTKLAVHSRIPKWIRSEHASDSVASA